MITRRQLVVGAGIATIAIPAIAAEPEPAPRPMDWTKAFGFVDPYAESQAFGAAVGTRPARAAEVTTAFQLLFAAPRGGAPIDVAQYFQNITRKNDDKELYNAEWRTRFNPVIVGFFCMTHQLPNDGDQTSWCAAFVNFCLAAAGRPLTLNALSGSFRTYGKETDEPQKGDIVVFSAKGERGKQGHGHVGFFMDKDKNGIHVLGGNQVGDTGTTGAVTIAAYKAEGKNLVIHSYRSIPSKV